MSSASDFFGVGGGIPVNGVLPLNYREPVYTDKDGTIWLRSGAIETDAASYPEAFIGYEGISGIDNSLVSGFSTFYENITDCDMCTDGEFWWVLNRLTDVVSKYTIQWVYTGEFWEMNTHVDVTETAPSGICTQGDYLWIIGYGVDKAWKFQKNGAYTGDSFDMGVSGITQPRAITWSGTHFYIVGTGVDNICQFDATGVFTSLQISVGAQDPTPMGLTWDDNNLWVLGANTQTLYKYSVAIGYTSINIDLSADTDNVGIEWHNGEFYVSGKGSGYLKGRVYRYSSEGVYRLPFSKEDGLPRNVTWDADNNVYYISGNVNNTVYKYNSDLTYSGFSFPAGGNINLRAVEVVDSMLWAVDTRGSANPATLYEYDSNGTATGKTIIVEAETSEPRNLCTDGVFLYLLSLDSKIFQYTKQGIYTGVSYDVSHLDTMSNDILYDEISGTFWVLGLTSDTLYQISTEGVYTGNNFTTNTQVPISMTLRDSKFEVMDNLGSGVTRLTKEVGVGIAKATDNESGQRYYVRIK